MNLLLATNGLGFGGAERIVLALAEAHAARGDRVLAVATTRGGPVGELLARAGAEVEVLGVRRTVDLSALLRLERAIGRFRPHVIHSHLAVADLACALAAHRRAALVTTIHNDGRRLPTGRRRAWHVALLAFAHRFAVSAEVAGALPRWLAAEVHRPSLADPDAPRLARDEARRALGVPPDAPLVLGVGRLERVKGFDVLAAAAPRLRTPGALVRVVGDGPERGALTAAGLVVLPPRADVAELLVAADVVVVPSRSEGFPQVPLEAMAAGRPVVGSRVGGLVEIVADGETGLLVPPEAPAALAEALDTLLAAPARAAALGEAGARRLVDRGLTRSAWLGRVLEVHRRVARLRFTS